MRAILCILMMLLVWTPSAVALFDTTTPQEYIARYNADIDKAPGPLKTVLGSETVEINITMDNGTYCVLGLEMENGMVVNLSTSEIEDPSITITTTESVIDGITGDPDPVKAFKQARDDGDVQITAPSIFTRLKLDALLSSISVLEFFIGLFS